MDFCEKRKTLETLIQTVRIYSLDIGIKFGLEKCALLMIRSGKRQTTGGIQLPNKDVRRKGSLRLLGNTGNGHHQQVNMKEKILNAPT